MKYHSKNSTLVSKDTEPVQVLQIFVAPGDDDEVCNHTDTRILTRLDITSSDSNCFTKQPSHKGEQHAWKEGDENNLLKPFSFDLIEEKVFENQMSTFINLTQRSPSNLENARRVKSTPHSVHASKHFSSSKPGSKDADLSCQILSARQLG